MLVPDSSTSAQGKKPVVAKVKRARSTERSGKKLTPVPKSKDERKREKLPVVVEASPEVSNDNVLETLPPLDQEALKALQRFALYKRFCRGDRLSREDAMRFWGVTARTPSASVFERIDQTGELIRRALEALKTGTGKAAIYDHGLLTVHRLLVIQFDPRFSLPSV